MSSNPKLDQIIHVGKKLTPKEGWTMLFLIEESPNEFRWVSQKGPTEISASSIESAMRHANKEWRSQSFRPLNCGFRYTAHVRDEHGANALFHEMGKSSESMNGTYHDEKLGHPVFVQNASREALDLWRTLKNAQL